MISLPQSVLKQSISQNIRIIGASCFLISVLLALYLQISDDRGIIIDGLAVNSFPHALAIKSELLHGLLLGKVWPLVEELPRCLVLKSRHVEESGRRADICCHGDSFLTPRDVKGRPLT